MSYNSCRQNLTSFRSMWTSATCGEVTSTIGSTYASVFPLPVGAETHTSRGGSNGAYSALRVAEEPSRNGRSAVWTVKSNQDRQG